MTLPVTHVETGRGAPTDVRDAVARLRSVYRASAVGWVDVGCPPLPDGVAALTYGAGAQSLVCVEGGATTCVAEAIDWVARTGAPAMMMVAGPALANVQVLVDAGWVCVAGHPLMSRAVRHDPQPYSLPAGEEVREVHAEDDVEQLRRLLAAVFVSGVGVPAPAADVLIRNWGLYRDREIVCCATTVRVGDVVAVWNVATRPDMRRHGYAHRLLDVVHVSFEEAGLANEFVLLAKEAGIRLYERLGYRSIDWWQGWSRPRWMLGNS